VPLMAKYRALPAWIFLMAVGAVLAQPAASAQLASGGDPFIPTIEKMKRSITPVMCIRPHAPTEGFSPLFVGTGFFISARGDFITAAHVVNAFASGQAGVGGCPMFLWFASLNKNFVGKLDVHFFAVAPSDCVIDPIMDIARCRTIDDLTSVKGVASPPPVQFDFAQQPDGTAVAITGFPLLNSLPVTSRGYIAAYQVGISGAAVIVLDRAAWPGGSGSPVYDSHGRVLGMLVQAGEGTASGISYARSSRTMEQFLAAHPVSARK